MVLLSTFSFLLSGPRAHAANPVVYLDVQNSVPVEQQFAVRVLIDTAVPLNAFSAVLRYPSDYLEFIRVNDGRSLINVWQGKPIPERDGEIQFSGGSFTPFQGTGGELLTIYFKARKNGTAEIAFPSAAAYRADGKGTQVIPDTKRTSVTIGEAKSGSPEAATPLVASDTAPPEIQTLELTPDPFNPSQKFVIFRAVDSGSGVKEAAIRSRSYFFWSGWRSVLNPAPVPASTWAIDFKVSDHEGNSTERILYDWNVFGWLAAKAGAILAFIVFALWGITRWRRAKMV